MDGAAEQVEYRDWALFYPNQGDSGILIETKNGFVRKHNGCSTILLDPNSVTGTVGLVQSHWLPLCFTHFLSFYAPLRRYDFGRPFLTRGCLRGARRQRAY